MGTLVPIITIYLLSTKLKNSLFFQFVRHNSDNFRRYKKHDNQALTNQSTTLSYMHYIIPPVYHIKLAKTPKVQAQSSLTSCRIPSLFTETKIFTSQQHPIHLDQCLRNIWMFQILRINRAIQNGSTANRNPSQATTTFHTLHNQWS